MDTNARWNGRDCKQFRKRKRPHFYAAGWNSESIRGVAIASAADLPEA
jgi:hypothetical protein